MVNSRCPWLLAAQTAVVADTTLRVVIRAAANGGQGEGMEGLTVGGGGVILGW